MRNKRGQALVEFILILPILLIIFAVIFDFGMFFSDKAKLDNDLTEAIMIYQDTGLEVDVVNYLKKSDDKVVVDYSFDELYVVFNVVKQNEPVTPGLNYLKEKALKINIIRKVKRNIAYD